MQIQNHDNHTTSTNTIVQLWRKNPKMLGGKFKSGATPKTQRETIKLNTEKKYNKIDFNDLDSTPPSRRVKPNLLIKKQVTIPKINVEVPALIKKISKIEQQQEECSPKNKKQTFVTPPKRTNNCDFDRTLKDSYKQIKSHIKEDDINSRFEKDYEELCTIGRGSFGVVKKCKNRVDGNVYAIKIMNPFEKNLNEVKALATLSNHQCTYIVRYHNSWIENGKLFMVMQYCQKSLKKIIEEHRVQNLRFKEKEIKEILNDVLKALQQLHKNNIVHLDIKPQNILRTFNGKYKIGDLGLSRIAQISYGQDVIEGDSRYLAKQILNNFDQEKLPDLTKADIFSFGITLYQLITLSFLPNGGQQWHYIRDGGMEKKLLPYKQFYSQKVLKVNFLGIQMIQNMTEVKFFNRQSAGQLLKKAYFFEIHTFQTRDQRDTINEQNSRNFSL